MNRFLTDADPLPLILGNKRIPSPDFAAMESRKLTAEVSIDWRGRMFTTLPEPAVPRQPINAPAAEAHGRTVDAAVSPAVDGAESSAAAAPYVPMAGDLVEVVGYLPAGSYPYGDGDRGIVCSKGGDHALTHMFCKPTDFVTYWHDVCHRLRLIARPDADGWYPHDGGPCPVPPETNVMVKLFDSTHHNRGSRAHSWAWGRYDDGSVGSGCITHYKVLS